VDHLDRNCAVSDRRALFHLLLLFNAAMTGAMAAFRGDSWRARRLTLWDEAVAFIGICLLTGLWR
jgi:hypothetical protein